MHFIDIVEELKSTRYSWKMKLTVGMFFEYDGKYKKVETERFIHSIQKTIMRESDSNVFAGDIIKSIANKYNDVWMME